MIYLQVMMMVLLSLQLLLQRRLQDATASLAQTTLLHIAC